MVSRLSKKKDWKKEYVERMETNTQRIIAHQQKQSMADEAAAVVDTTIASSFILEILGKGEEVADRALQKMMCRHNLENLEPPADPIPWNSCWGSQILCDICSRPGITDCTICRKCNTISHNQCIVDARGNVSDYICPNCVESIRSEKDYYTNMLKHLERERKIERDARKISKRLVVVVERRRLTKKRNSVILLQSVVRCYLARKKYLKWLRSQMKLVTVKLTHIPAAVIENGVVVLTVYDTYKNAQQFRLDATAEEAIKQGFLIPGCGSNLSILLTLARREESMEGRRQYIMLGQAQLNLRDVINFTKRSNFDINFLEKIKWPPLESKGEYKYHLINFTASSQYNPNASLLNNLSSGASVAASTTSLLPYITSPSGKNTPFMNNSMFSGSSVSGGGSIFSSSGSLTSSFNAGAGQGSVFTSSTGAPGNPSNNIHVNPIARLLFANDRLCSLQFYPQNSVINVVAMVSGPPLDILKRASEAGMKKMKVNTSGVNYRNSRYWLCLYRLKLIFFQYFGDIAPRLVSDVSEATAVMLHDGKGRSTPLVNVVHADMRVWLLEFDTRKEASKFIFALQESRKACSEGGSIFALKSEIVSPDSQFDFKMATTY